ncbi:hypothetical protein ANANG_G00038450, partial [Anguilla anguilla]
MTDGEGREHFHCPENEEVRVPISGAGEDPGDEDEGGSTVNPTQGSTGSRDSSGRDPAPDLASDDEEEPPYPALAPVVFFCLKQSTRPRNWCLRLVCN